jgi:hypothetical protein
MFPSRCRAFNSRKVGSASAVGGMRIATIVTVRTIVRPRNRPIARPYPAGRAVASVRAVAPNE